MSESVLEAWVAGLPPEATSERVRPGFWYVRLPGSTRAWIPLEIEFGQRTVKVTSRVIIPPDERHADVYEYLLRHNFAAPGVAFALDPKGVISLVARIDLAALSSERLDDVAGRMVETTDKTFRGILEMGFATRLRRRQA